MLRQALNIKEGMIGKNLQPDARLYLALSRGLCVGIPHIEDLLHLVQEMRSKKGMNYRLKSTSPW